MADNLAFISKASPTDRSRLRLAVKDIIDVAGFVTTAGSRAVADTADPAKEDAECVSLCLHRGAQVVGKTNLHELAVFATGINPWFGTPRNPLDSSLIPGGSSSGSAVAVACDQADVALGTDTGGSIRIPAACCGVAGLKPTLGMVSAVGVHPLAPSLDTVGPMARDITTLKRGWNLLAAPSAGSHQAAGIVGRIRTTAHPSIEQAIDFALMNSELDVRIVEIPHLDIAEKSFSTIFDAELWNSDHTLLNLPEPLGEDVENAIRCGSESIPGLPDALISGRAWRVELLKLFRSVELLVLPTIPIFPPSIAEAKSNPRNVIRQLVRYTSPFNLAGLPALALPIPIPLNRIPASIQLVGPPDGEPKLLETALLIDAAVRTSEKYAPALRD